MKRILITVSSSETEENYKRICEGFLKKFPEAQFEKKVDNSIIGGFIADVDGEIFDLSISSQLKKMRSYIQD